MADSETKDQVIQIKQTSLDRRMEEAAHIRSVSGQNKLFPEQRPSGGEPDSSDTKQSGRGPAGESGSDKTTDDKD